MSDPVERNARLGELLVVLREEMASRKHRWIEATTVGDAPFEKELCLACHSQRRRREKGQFCGPWEYLWPSGQWAESAAFEECSK
jgi:hypothetical protein